MMIREAVDVSRETGHVLEGEKVVITGGIMSSKPGSTDFINVWEVE
jgi:pyruvate kinase